MLFIGVGDGEGALAPSPPQKKISGKIFFGKISSKIRELCLLSSYAYDAVFWWRHFQKVAIRILDRMKELDHSGSYRVLISELPFELGPYVTPLAIADDAEAMDFMSQGNCQKYLERVWKGNMAVNTPAWKVSLSSLCNVLKYTVHVFMLIKLLFRHTPCPEKRVQSSSANGHNFIKCWPIFEILSQSQSAENLQ